MKKSFLLLIILFALKGYSQSYEIAGVFGDNRKMSPDEILLSEDKCIFSLLYNGNNITPAHSKWEIKIELSDQDDEEYITIHEINDNTFSFYIDDAFNKLSWRYKRYEIDKSVMYKGIIDFEGKSQTGEEIKCSFPVMLNLLPSIPEIKIIDIYWGIYDEIYRCYDDAYMIIEVHAERLSRVLGHEIYPGTVGYTFYLDLDPETNQGKIDFLYDDSHFIIYACNSNGSVASKDTIYIKELELLATGINDRTKEKITFYPNPVKDILYIQKEDNYTPSISIYSLTGILVKSIDSVIDPIDVSDLPKGTYLLEHGERNHKKREILKLMKE